MEHKIERFDTKLTDSQGMTLLELAIAILIMGVVTAGLISIIQPIVESGKKKETEKKMERIIDVLAIYAQRNNRIPCPGDPDRTNSPPPFGAELNSGAGGAGLGSCDPAAGDIIEGVVPYKTLGLNEQDVVDGWGYHLTYRVDPAFARDTNAAIDVHARCRTETLWIYDDAGINRHYNPAKARFCCAQAVPAAGSEIIIEDENNDPVWPFSRAAGGYSDVLTSEPSNTAFNPATDNITMPAFILISHGHNGYGAFLPENGGGRMPITGAPPTNEQENQDGDNLYVISPRSNAQTTDYFDDIVMWRTQDQLYSETGEGTCVYP